MWVPPANLMELYGAELCGVLGLQNKSTPLHFAAANGHSGAVQLLLTAKANPKAETSVSDLPSCLVLACVVICCH